MEQLADYIGFKPNRDFKVSPGANLFRMRQFYETYNGDKKVAPLVRQLPWSHHLMILGQRKRQEEREFYMRTVVQERSKREPERPTTLEKFDGPTLAIYLGTSIGNFTPKESQRILRNLGSQLGDKDALLLGTDLVKDESTLVAAYHDSQGVTAAFNLNILNRLNRELGANFDLTSFRHCVRWNPVESRIEMHLESIRCQNVQVPAANLELDFRIGETIHTENSRKFTDETLAALLSESGFQINATWKDTRHWYALTLSQIGNGGFYES